MTADLPCLKNVRLVLETIGHLGYSQDKIKLVLNRSTAFTGINVKNVESALKRTDAYEPGPKRILICGSLYLAGHVLALLLLVGAVAAHELDPYAAADRLLEIMAGAASPSASGSGSRPRGGA